MTAPGAGTRTIDADLKALVWRQFGAAIDMLENAIRHCPESVWSDRSRQPEFWYLAYHTLFWLDYYLAESPKGFAPPAPYGLEELDPAGLMPARVYSRDEMLAYLAHGRKKCRGVVAGLTGESAYEESEFGTGRDTILERLVYNMRHVQHHAAQLNLILRQRIDSAPGWVARTKVALTGG